MSMRGRLLGSLGFREGIKNYRVLFLLSSFGSIIMGCDIAHETVICNGFKEPISVIYANKALSQAHSLSVEPSACAKPSHATPMTEQARLAIGRNLPDGVTVVSAPGKILAHFGFGAFNEGPRLHSPQQLMLVEDGVFHVSYEFQDNWFNNIQKVKQASPHSWPNLERKY